MAKKTFRPVGSDKPRYPRPDELKSRSLRDLGLVAVGSLLLGVAAGIPLVQAEEAKVDSSAKSPKVLGGMRPARHTNADKPVLKSKSLKTTSKGRKLEKKKPAPSAAKAKPAPDSEIFPPGLMPPPRHPDPVPSPKKQTPTPKPGPQSDAGVPTEPQRIPTRGKPALPRNYDDPFFENSTKAAPGQAQPPAPAPTPTKK